MAILPAPKQLLYAVPGSAAEHRLQVQYAAEERAALRADELAEQVSPAKDAQERIRIWERLHALRLPRASGHVLVRVIATQTRLTIGQVHEEQRRRAVTIAQPKALPREGGAASQGEPMQAGNPAAPRRDA
jgi:uncharacterized protein YmfQ (DUF2313 family)